MNTLSLSEFIPRIGTGKTRETASKHHAHGVSVQALRTRVYSSTRYINITSLQI